MDSSQDICGICREDCCDFETRCRHVFHEECLKAAVFSKRGKKCPYCRVEISPLKFIEAFVRANGDCKDLESFDIKSLKKIVKYCLRNRSIPIEPILQKMINLGWDVDELNYWFGNYHNDELQSLFYASYVCGHLELSHKLIELGCQLVRKRKNQEAVNYFEIKCTDIDKYVKYQGYKDVEDEDEDSCDDSDSDNDLESDENESVLPYAVKNNDMQFVQKLLDLGVDMNSLDLNTSALDVACENDNAYIAAFLLENGAKINFTNSRSKISLRFNASRELSIRYEVDVTSIILACLNGSLNAIRALYRHCPDLLSDDSVSWSAFTVAIKLKNIALIDLLIELGGNINSVDAQFNRNLFVMACIFGDIQIVKFIFEKGNFDIDSVDSLGNCAILYSKRPEVVKYLIDNEADPLSRTRDDKYTILHIAYQDKNYELIEYLFSETIYADIDLKTISTAKKGLVELCVLCHDEIDFKILGYLLQRGVDITETNSETGHVFPRSYICSYKTIKFLLQHGADVNSVDAEGRNCLQNLFLNSRAYDDFIMLLVDHGIDLNSQTNNGRTIMHILAEKDIEIIEYFLESGARADIPDNEGLYPFDLAFKREIYNDSVEVFEKRGLNYSKFVGEDIRSHKCDHCNGKSATLKGRCGHHLHICCLKNQKICPICDSRLSRSNKMEAMIKEHNYDEIALLSDMEVRFLLDNYIEDDRVIEFDTISMELKRRKRINNQFSISYCSYSIDVYTKACAYGRFELIELFELEKFVKIDYSIMTDSVVCTAVSGNILMVEHLLNKFGPKYMNIGHASFRPIQIACTFRNTKLFDFLVESGADMTVMYFNQNLLQSACNFGSFEIVQKLIEDHGFDPSLVYNSRTILHSLVEDNIKMVYSNLNYFRKSIEAFIKVNEKTEDDCLEIAKYLLDRGADLNIADNDCGDTPVSFTGLYNREKLFDFFVQYCENILNEPLKLKQHKTLLIAVSKCGKNLEFFEKVIRMGADINWVDKKGFTALMGACSSGNYEMCRRLIELGANVNAADNDHYTALHHLCEKGGDNVNILELLLENGADFNQTTIREDHALHFAAKHFFLNTVKKLLFVGSDPNCINFSCETPLYSLLHYRREEKHDILPIVKELVEAGADFNAEFINGESPLSIANKHIKFRNVAKYLNNS